MEQGEAQPEKSNGKIRLEEDISIHIFSASAMMVGVCLTAIGIFQIGSLRKISSISDKLLAVDAAAFLISCILSYASLRTRTQNRRHRIERIADFTFIGGLSLMAVVCCLVAYEVF